MAKKLTKPQAMRRLNEMRAKALKLFGNGDMSMKDFAAIDRIYKSVKRTMLQNRLK